MRSDNIVRVVLCVVTVLFFSFLIAGCGASGSADSVTNPESGPGPASLIELEATAYKLTANGESVSTITATVTDGYGVLVEDGTLVTFAITSGMGRLKYEHTETQEETDYTVGGQAIMAYYASEIPGMVTIKASTNNGISRTLNLELGMGEISLSAAPDELLANGQSESIITATITDVNGDPAEDADRINFAITSGTGRFKSYYANEMMTWKRMSGGAAAATYMASRTPGPVTITASAPGYISGTKEVLLAGEELGTLSLTSDPTSIRADGASSSSITAIIKNSSGNNVSKGTRVEFYTTRGRFPNGSMNYSATTPDDSGVITVPLISGNTSGAAEVTCFSKGVSQKTTVDFFGGTDVVEPATIVLAVTPQSIQVGGGSAAISAMIKDGSGDPSPAGTQVTFSTTLGTFPNGKTTYSSAIAGENGILTVSLVSGNVSGSADVRCEAGGVSQLITVEFTGGGVDNAPAAISLEISPESIQAGGNSSAAITATITDSSKSPVPRGTPVTFDTSLGRFANGSTRYSTETSGDTGVVVASLVSSTVSGTAEVVVTSGGVSQKITAAFFGGTAPPGRISLTTEGESIPAGGKTSVAIIASISDSSGNPVPRGTPVKFSTTRGMISSSETFTPDDSGRVVVSLISSEEPGIAEVTCEAGGVSQTITVAFAGDAGGLPAAMINLSVSPATIPPDNASSAAITAEIKSRSGEAVSPGTTVIFETDLGRFSNGDTRYAITTPDSTGTVTISLIAASVSGTAQVTCEADGVFQKITVEFINDTVQDATVTLIANPPEIPADGTSFTRITALLKDSSGKIVPSGTPVTFATTRGTFSNGSTSWSSSTPGDNSGAVTAMLTSGTVPDTEAEVTCHVAGVSQSITVNFTSSGIDVVPAAISLTPDTAAGASIPADGQTSLAITASVTDTSGQAVPKGTDVSFFTSRGKFSNGDTAYYLQTPDDSGSITVSLIASHTPGTAEVTCFAGNRNVSQKTNVTFVRVAGEDIAAFSLSLSQITVKSDNSDSTTITATVLDKDKAVVPGVPVNFSADGGQLSSAEVKTDENGQAVVTFSSGTADRTNQIVNITASVAEYEPKNIPVQVIGTNIDISTDNTILEIGGDNEAILTVTVYDAGMVPVHGVPVTLEEVDETDNTRPVTDEKLILTPMPGYEEYITDISGIFKAKIVGKATGDAVLAAEALGARMTQAWSVGSIAEIFGIASPEEELVSLSTGKSLEIRVRAPGRHAVNFSTTFGTWVENNGQVLRVSVTNDVASARLTSLKAGLATVQVFDADDSSTSDIVKVAIAAPSDEASQIDIQTSSSVLAPSIGDIMNKATLTATVKNASDQVVGGAAVAFSLEDTTGGGESISPVVVYSDSFGKATTTFTSGSLSSDARGVTVKATVVGKTSVKDQISLVIGGSAGSVLISESTVIAVNDNNTAYQLKMSVLVSDANGNPVSGAQVSLGAWPARYATGGWGEPAKCPQIVTGVFLNEDENKNLILDAGEDANENDELTPPNSSAGVVIPSVVTTGENGTADFDLVYLKSSAGWIEEEITATTLVMGTETQSTYTFWLRWLEAEQCSLPLSPYNAQPGVYISMTADSTTLTADGESQSTIRASVTDANGRKVEDGTIVRFATTAGSLSDATAETYDGIASVTFTSPDYLVDSAQITASVKDTTSEGLRIYLTSGTGSPEWTTILATPSSLSADGRDTSQIQANVKDAKGNVVASGTMIVFEVSMGGGTLSSRTATTNDDGLATVTYTSPTFPGTATVTAKLSDGTNLGGATITLADVIVGSVEVTPGAPAIAADGVSETLLTATVRDTEGNLVKDGTPVIFTTSAGQICKGISCGPSEEVSTANGIALVMLRSSEYAGTATVTASANGVIGTADVDFVSGAVAEIILSATSVSLGPGGTSSIRASVTDANGNPVSGQTITFSVLSGGGELSVQTATTSDGVASVDYTAPSAEGEIRITATAVNGVRPDSPLIISVDAGAIIVSSVVVNPGALGIVADGVSETVLSATVRDGDGNLLKDGTTVNFATTAGRICKGTTCRMSMDVPITNGVATVMLRSSEYAGTAKITVSAGGVIGTTDVQFTSGAAAEITLSASPDKLAPGGISTIRALVKDESGNPVNGETITFSVASGDGVLSGQTAVTYDGLATVTYTAGPAHFQAIISATAVNGVRSNSLSIGSADVIVGTVTVDRGTDSIVADGTSQTRIMATVKDNAGNPVKDGTVVSFTTTAGRLCEGVSCLMSMNVPTESGVASAMLRSTENAGTATVTVSAGGVSGTTTVGFISGTVAEIVLTASPDSFQTGGTSNIRALITDAKGNPVSGEKITFAITAGGGILSPQTATASDGAATVLYTASSTAGQVTITATATNGTQPETPLILGVAPDGIGEVLITASELSIPADGQSTAWITATVKDSKGAVAPNVPVTFKDVTDESNPRKLAVTDTDQNGEATFPYTSTRIKGVITIRAEAGTENAEIEITQTAGPPARISVSAVPDTIYANGENESVIRAEVKDDGGNLVGDGHDVTFTTTAGIFENGGTSFIASTKDGIAVAQLTAPLTEGIATVTASVENVAETPQTSITFLGISLFDMAATPPAIDADGISFTEIRVRLKDSNGIAVAGETVVFSTTAGTLDSQSAITGADGIATVNLIAPLISGLATVTARYGMQDAPEEITVNFKPPSEPPIASVSLSADPESLPADGSSTSSISATVTAVEGEVADDTPVEFTITRGGGNFEGGEKTITAYTYGGVAFVTLTSGEAAEIATIQARVGGRTAELEVEYTPGSISLLIIPNTILGTKDSTTTITATLKDVTGNPAAPGENVEFTLDNVSMGEFVINELGDTRPSFTGVTDDQGEVQAIFRSSAVGGVVKVTASWITNNVEVTGTGDITVQSPPAFIKTATGYPDPDAVNIKGTGGQATSQIIFDVNDSMGNPVADGYRIDFIILSGPNGREEISPTFGYTVGGQVSTVLRSGSKPGPVSVNATYFYDSSVGNDASLAIVAGPPVGEAFGIYAQYVNISGLWKFGLNNTVTVDAGDFWGNSVPNNTAISFKTYNTGGLFDPGTAVTSEGSATNALYSVPNPVPSQGFVSVTAEAINGGRTTHVTSLSVVRDTEHNQILYAGTDGGGVYKSTDSGATWGNISRSSTIQGQNWIDPYVNDIAADPDNPNTIHAATGYSGGGHVYRSLDGGLNWNSNNVEEWNGVFATDAAVQTILADDDGCDSKACNPDICYYEYYDYQEGEYVSKEIPCYQYVWIGTKGMGAYFAPDGKHFQWGGSVTTPEPTGINQGDGSMSRPVISATSISERWTATFYCTDTEDPCGGYWRVSGSKSGVQSATATTNLNYASDNGEVAFAIISGGKPFEQGDNFTFDVSESGLGYGTYVYDIVKVKNTHGDSAILYAATGSGIFKSINGGQTYEKRGSAGDSVNTLALHPTASGGENDVIYAGTNDSGVWVSTDSGTSWTAHTSGMGKGLSATTPVADNNNKGYGMMSKVAVFPGCLSETWTVACVSESPNGGVFSVTGTISGARSEYDITTGEYSIPNMLSFTINDGTGSGGTGGFKIGDTFSFNTTKDPGKYIKDLLVDPKHQLLYAVTYFLGALEPHAVGNLYVHGLNPDGSMVPEDWREANIGLPLYDPPDDVSLFAQHVMAADDPDAPTSLYIGGEGINFFKATSGLDNGAPVWQESKSGLTNLIMARTPVLFSGLCELEWTTESFGDGRKHIVYLQDKNGNPPIAGTKIRVIRIDINDSETTLLDHTYSDTLTHKGTWSDPSDPTTNNPYEFYTGQFDSLEIERTPVCGDSVPGCSWGD